MKLTVTDFLPDGMGKIITNQEVYAINATDPDTGTKYKIPVASQDYVNFRLGETFDYQFSVIMDAKPKADASPELVDIPPEAKPTSDMVGGKDNPTPEVDVLAQIRDIKKWIAELEIRLVRLEEWANDIQREGNPGEIDYPGIQV